MRCVCVCVCLSVCELQRMCWKCRKKAKCVKPVEDLCDCLVWFLSLLLSLLLSFFAYYLENPFHAALVLALISALFHLMADNRSEQ